MILNKTQFVDCIENINNRYLENNLPVLDFSDDEFPRDKRLINLAVSDCSWQQIAEEDFSSHSSFIAWIKKTIVRLESSSRISCFGYVQDDDIILFENIFPDDFHRLIPILRQNNLSSESLLSLFPGELSRCRRIGSGYLKLINSKLELIKKK